MAAYTNSYKEPEKPTLLPGYFGPDPYDINWAFPLYEETLESERVKLTPFIPSLHAQEYTAQVSARPDLHQWIPLNLSSLDHVLTEVELRVRRNPSWILFAIIDKARGGAMAGVVGLIGAAENLSAEIVWLLVFPAFQRTYVSSNAVGILLQYTLELPSSPDPGSGRRRGLGFRRVQWTADTGNKPSHAVARRMGLKEEGVLRWTWVLHDGGGGNELPLRAGDPFSPVLGRHSARFAICVDDWESGGREHVERLIE